MIYNPLDTFYKSKIGAVCEEDFITFRITGDFNKCYLIVKEGKSKFESATDYYSFFGCTNYSQDGKGCNRTMSYKDYRKLMSKINN